MVEKNFNSREKIFSYLDDYASDIKSQLNTNRTVNTLLKSYIFETFTKQKGIDTAQIYSQRGYEVSQVDEAMLRLDKGSQTVGFIEEINPRFSVLYSVDKAQHSDAYTNNLVRQIPLLDSLWISGKLFDLFWEKIQRDHSPHRYIKMKFEFDGFFDSNTITKHYSHQIDIESFNEEIYDDQKVTTITLVEELSELNSKINGVREFFPAFNSVGLLRFPSYVGKGGHDFYRNGKVTNRSESFKDHRYQINNTINEYQKITEAIEQTTWINFDTYKNDHTEGISIKGSPIVFKFARSLKEHVFHNFIEYTFRTGKEPFRILGKPIWINENKVHIYGTDIHLWQKVLLELSREEFVVILPTGTCGNTIHRLVTNIQRYLDPGVSVFIGDQSYDYFMRGSLIE
ncbi:hypothetical protein [Paenibacillus zanthoxyli]|uniref:hypothetical protein n=1 Tax=Paenibacillus zanthoxyli TaxID=369399 RepID=UPI000470AA18|nr:hypothetical protein [Paenibacillus zanthoxyli]